MRKEFSTHWIGSKQPRKQRKYLAKAPNHIKAKIMSSSLSKELRLKHKIRSIPIRKGDSVKVLSGSFKKKTGKVAIVNRNKMKVAIEEIQRTKKEGSKVNVWFYPSTLQITELNLEDKKRLEKNTEIKKISVPATSKRTQEVSGIEKKINPKEIKNAH